MKILVTGFEPWGKWSRNPSGEIAESLAGQSVGPYELVTGVLPVAFGGDIAEVRTLIELHRPEAVLSLGLSGAARALQVERVAVNLKVEEGEDLPVVEGGPAAYFATLPTREMVDFINERGIEAGFSYSAGTFLCNHIMFSVLHFLESQKMNTPAGFIHLPPVPEQTDGKYGMELSRTRTGVLAGLQSISSFLGKLSGVGVV